MAAEFIKRSSRYARCEMREIHPARLDPWVRHPAAVKLALDPAGRLLDSREFVRMVERWEREGRDVVFLVGGADGLPPGWAERADERMALSPLTFPHELARVLLAEQIYRALTTLRGHPYPR
jgi:23S rRNA (pseudouridine1915-N3)-methyltransferase